MYRIATVLSVCAFIGVNGAEDYTHCNKCCDAGHVWCPLDTICHQTGSLYNPCDVTNKVTKKALCPTPSPTAPTRYDETVASMAMMYAGAAYTKNFTGCLPASFKVTYSKSKAIFGNKNNVISGYVGVDTAENLLIVAFEGTSVIPDQLYQEYKHAALVDLAFDKCWPDGPPAKGSLVNEYFSRGMEVLYEDLMPVLSDLTAKYPGYSILVTGHSLGGALATLSTYLGITCEMDGKDPPFKDRLVYVYTFGEPRVGNYPFAADYDARNGNHYRLIYNRDPVPHVAPCTPYSYPDLEGDSSQCPDISLGATLYWPCCIRDVYVISDTGVVMEHVVNGSYWHNGVEVWYPEGENEQKKLHQAQMCGHRICTGLPSGEDEACSNNGKPTTLHAIKEHGFYKHGICGFSPLKAGCW